MKIMYKMLKAFFLVIRFYTAISIPIETISSSHTDHNCVLGNGTAKCFGYNNWGQLGYGSTNNIGDGVNEMGESLKDLDLGFIPKQIVAGGGYQTGDGSGTYVGGHTCAISIEDQLKCWGLNDYGQLGYEDISNRGDSSNEMGSTLQSINLGSNFIPMSISMGLSHTCALSTLGNVKCWGYNSDGELGLGYTSNAVGISSNQMGDDLPVVNLGSNFYVNQMCSGYWHNCAISNESQIKCWGWNSYTNKPAFSCGVLGLETDELGKGDDNADMGDALPLVNLGPTFIPKEISCGGLFTCVLSTTGNVKCWGCNKYGQLGIENSDN